MNLNDLNFEMTTASPRRAAAPLRCVSRLLCGCFFLFLAVNVARAETYYSEDFEGKNPPIPQCWYSSGSAKITTDKAISGKHSVLIESPTAYWELPLAKSLKWDRADPAGVGNRPLYLSMHVYAASGGTLAFPGFRGTIAPKRRPPSGGTPISDEEQVNIAGRTGQWLLLCLDVGKALQRAEDGGHYNADHVILESVAFLVCNTGGKFYVDNIRLSTERPAGCSPPPTPITVDAAAHLRRDAKLEGMVLHGIYGGHGAAPIGDVQFHPAIVRDVKRHYLNFTYGFDYRANSPEPILQAVEQSLDQAAKYDILYMPTSYIGDKYGSAAGWSDEKLRTAMVKIVRRFKNKSHLLGWYLEEESGMDRAATCLKQKGWVEQEDPNHNVWTIFSAGGPTVQALGPAYSVVNPDIYPIQGNSANPWMVPRFVARDVPKFKQPYLVTEQIFAGGGGWTVPTLGQWRLMVYGALAEGAKGFFHFVYTLPPLYQMPDGDRLYGTMVDAYGTPSAIYQEIERRLGPDLFSVGELLRTCHPDQSLSAIRMECRTVEDSLEKAIPAIVARRLVDTEGGYEILALYSNDPEKTQAGTLQIPAAWLGDRVVIDLNAHSRDILRQEPILVEGERVPVQLDAGDGRFFAVVAKTKSGELIRRMQARRFEAMRKMVEFDCRWLAEIGVGSPYSTKQWDDLQQLCDQKSPCDALQQVLRLEKANQELIQGPRLAPVLGELDAARAQLTVAADTISKWAVPKKGQPFPPSVEPGKSYCQVQDKLGELYIGLSDLAYSHAPEALVKPTEELAKLCTQNAETLKKVSGSGVPKESCRLTLEMLKPLEKQLAVLGWSRPPTPLELQRQAAR